MRPVHYRYPRLEVIETPEGTIVKFPGKITIDVLDPNAQSHVIERMRLLPDASAIPTADPFMDEEEILTERVEEKVEQPTEQQVEQHTERVEEKVEQLHNRLENIFKALERF